MHSGQKNGASNKSHALKVTEPMRLDASEVEQVDLWESVDN
jgi:hypothetical protein